MTVSAYAFTMLSCISTHILTKRMTSYRISPPHLETFQLTSSRRGWQNRWEFTGGVYLFQLTSSRRGWLQKRAKWKWKRKFQLTSSRRGWPRWLSCQNNFLISTHILTKRMTAEEEYEKVLKEFQLTSSRRGWRWIRWHKLKCFIISTHILTKRMTAHASEFPLYQNISTHILTKRMTRSVSDLVAF